jgi:hypothetical protein
MTDPTKPNLDLISAMLKGKFQADCKNPAKSPDIFERLAATVDDVGPAILSAWGRLFESEDKNLALRILGDKMWQVGFDYFPVNAERFCLDMLAENRPAPAE